MQITNEIQAATNKINQEADALESLGAGIRQLQAENKELEKVLEQMDRHQSTPFL